MLDFIKKYHIITTLPVLFLGLYFYNYGKKEFSYLFLGIFLVLFLCSVLITFLHKRKKH